MKHNTLRSIAHNIAHSLASGIGLLIGVYEMDIFGEARRRSDGFITIDFLRGKAIGGSVSPSLAEALKLYSEALPRLCQSHGASHADFRELTARYSLNAHGEGQFIVTIEDKAGRRSTDEYSGFPGHRIKVLDPLGRLRPKRMTSM